MADLMGENPDDLVRGKLLYECVEEDDPLLPAVAGEIGVGLGASLGSIHHVDVLQLESNPGGEGLDGRAQLALLKRLLLVEKGDDELRVEILEEQDESHIDTPGDEPEPLGIDRIDPHAQGEQAAADQRAHQEGLHSVTGEDLGSRLVESELLFHNESLVDGEGEGDEESHDIDEAEEAESLENRLTGDAPRHAVQPAVSAEGEKGKGDEHRHGR